MYKRQVHVVALLVGVVVVRVAVVPAVLFRREGATFVVVTTAIIAVVTPFRVVEVPAPGVRVRTELEPRGLLAAVVVPRNSGPRLRRVALDRVLACVSHLSSPALPATMHENEGDAASSTVVADRGVGARRADDEADYGERAIRHHDALDQMRLAALLAAALADEDRRRDEDRDVHNHVNPSEPRVERYVECEEHANSHANRGDAGAHDDGRARAALVAPAALVVGGLGHGVAVLVALPARCD